MVWVWVEEGVYIHWIWVEAVVCSLNIYIYLGHWQLVGVLEMGESIFPKKVLSIPGCWHCLVGWMSGLVEMYFLSMELRNILAHCFCCMSHSCWWRSCCHMDSSGWLVLHQVGMYIPLVWDLQESCLRHQCWLLFPHWYFSQHFYPPCPCLHDQRDVLQLIFAVAFSVYQSWVEERVWSRCCQPRHSF